MDVFYNKNFQITSDSGAGRSDVGSLSAGNSRDADLLCLPFNISLTFSPNINYAENKENFPVFKKLYPGFDEGNMTDYYAPEEYTTRVQRTMATNLQRTPNFRQPNDSISDQNICVPNSNLSSSSWNRSSNCSYNMPDQIAQHEGCQRPDCIQLMPSKRFPDQAAQLKEYRNNSISDWNIFVPNSNCPSSSSDIDINYSSKMPDLIAQQELCQRSNSMQFMASKTFPEQATQLREYQMSDTIACRKIPDEIAEPEEHQRYGFREFPTPNQFLNKIPELEGPQRYDSTRFSRSGKVAAIKKPIQNQRSGSSFNRQSGRSSTFCSFCRKNGEPAEIFTSHNMKDPKGYIECFILKKHVCDVCGATGVFAHTRKYCPSFREQKKFQPAYRRLSNGKVTVSHSHK